MDMHHTSFDNYHDDNMNDMSALEHLSKEDTRLLEERLAADEVKLSTMTHLFQRVMKKCFKDCCNLTYSDVYMAEMVCTKRCVERFMTVHREVVNVYEEMTRDERYPKQVKTMLEKKLAADQDKDE